VNQGSCLLWRCRRGIREMDLLLQRFMECRYDQLSDAEKQAFAGLLEQPDLEIMDWIMGRGTLPPEPLLSIIKMIRDVNNPAAISNN